MSPSKGALVLGIDTMTDGSLITDATRKIVHSNPAFTRITGYEAAEILGRDCSFLQGPETDPATVERIRRALDEGRPYHGDIVNYRNDGSMFWNSLIILPVRSETGQVTHYVSVQRDIRDEIDHQKDLERRLFEAETSRQTDLLLLHAATALNGQRTLEAVYVALVDGILLIGKPDTAAVATHVPGSDHLVINATNSPPASTHIDPIELQELTADIGGIPTLIDRRTHPSAAGLLEKMAAQSVAAVPFHADGLPSVVLYAVWRTDHRQSAPVSETLRGLTYLAELAATSIDRAV